jgi:ribonuclease T1
MSQRFRFRFVTVGLLAIMGVLSACGGSTATIDRPATSTLAPASGGSGSAAPKSKPTPTTEASDKKPSKKSTTTARGSDLVSADAPLSDLDTISLAELPDQAIETLTLIASDGPFPYSKDGVTFQNRERILPKQARSYYHEYTVETPGSSDRGARRVIIGDGGERFYTDDHYDSFKEIVP